jgi:hypothetical protein
VVGYISGGARLFQGAVSLLGDRLMVLATQTTGQTDIATNIYGDTRQGLPDSAQPLHDGGGSTDWHHGGHQHRPNDNEPVWLTRPLPPRADAVAICTKLRELSIHRSGHRLHGRLASRLHQLRHRSSELLPSSAGSLGEPGPHRKPVSRTRADLCLPRELQCCS